jgi:outer membrane protein assembly factor BamB
MTKGKLTTGVLVGCVLLSATCVQAQDWPQWRGPNRDNKVAGFTVPKEWPKELKKGWSTKVGMGDASPVLVGDKLYVFTREGGDEYIRCLNASDGNEVWKDKYTATAVTGPGAGIHAGTRSSPAVADGKVCTLGAAGVLSCLDAAKGTVVWRKDIKAWPQFFTASSPIIIDGKCIAFLGGSGRGGSGKSEFAAYDLASGDEKWKWTGEAAAYSSPVLMTVDKTKMLVVLSDKALVGIDPGNGKLLWETAFKSRYNSETPVADGDIVICSGAGPGTVAYKIEKKDDTFSAKQLWKQTVASGIYNTPLLKDGLIYGLASGGGRGSTTLFCLKADTGDKAWTDDTKRGECGGVLDAGSVLFLFSSDSELVVFKPSDKKFEEVAKYKIASSPTWAYPIIAGNRVFVKDKDSVTLWTIE